MWRFSVINYIVINCPSPDITKYSAKFDFGQDLSFDRQIALYIMVGSNKVLIKTSRGIPVIEYLIVWQRSTKKTFVGDSVHIDSGRIAAVLQRENIVPDQFTILPFTIPLIRLYRVNIGTLSNNGCFSLGNGGAGDSLACSQRTIYKTQTYQSPDSRNCRYSIKPQPDVNLPSPMIAFFSAVLFCGGLWLSSHGFLQNPCGLMHVGGWLISVFGGLPFVFWLIVYFSDIFLVFSPCRVVFPHSLGVSV